jgi:uncharacterized protein (DUF427 family)
MTNRSPHSPTSPGPGQESVWDYPRPPRVEPVAERVRVVVDGVTIADTMRALRVLETSHPPAYYLPPEDVRLDLLAANARSSVCEFKGRAAYVDLLVPGEATASGRPRSTAQEGDFYGGWITSRVVGPFKGGPGTWGW